MENKKGIKRYIGDKAFYKSVFAIIIPIMLQQLFLSLAGYIDTLMINSYGGNSFAYMGVSAANKIIFVGNFITLGIISAVAIFIAQYFGAGNKNKVKESFRLSLYLMIITGIIQCIVIKIFGYKVVDSYIENEIARQCGYRYLDVICYGQIFVSIDMALANAYRTIQRPTIPLVIGIIGIGVNIFFNYCMIFGHFGFNENGAAGAAIATVISKIVEIVLYVFATILFKIDWLRRPFKKLKITKELMKKFVVRGTPVILNEVFWSVSMVLLTKFYTYGNDMWYNAYAYTENITDLFFIVFAGLGNGTAIIIGSSLGNNEFDKAITQSYYFKGLAVIMGLFTGILMALTSGLTSRILTSDPEMLSIMSDVLKVTSIFTSIYCYNSVCFFILRSGGDSYRAIILDQTPTYLVGLPIAIIFGINASKWGTTIIETYLFTHVLDIVKLFLSNSFVKQNKWVKNLTIRNQI